MWSARSFPGYVLVKMVLTDESWYVVRNIRGCTGFVGPSSDPDPADGCEEVAAAGCGEAQQVEVSYDVGDSVQIVDGPLEGLCGHRGGSRYLEKNRVRVTVSPCLAVKRRWSWSWTRRKQWIKGLFRKVRALGGSQRADKMVIRGEPLIMRDEVPWGAGTEASPVGGTGEIIVLRSAIYHEFWRCK